MVPDLAIQHMVFQLGKCFVSSMMLSYCVETKTCIILHIPASHLVFLPFSEEFEIVCDRIWIYLMLKIAIEDLHSNTIVLPMFNSAVNLWYLDKKRTNPHRDQQHTPNGDFYYAMNSQVENTTVAILVIGDARQLTFELYRNYDRTDPNDIRGRPGTVRVNGPGSTKVIPLKHGTLFMLHPNDEKTVFRSFFTELESRRKTFLSIAVLECTSQKMV